MRRAAAAMGEMRVWQEAARRICVWRQQRLKNEAEHLRAETTSRMRYEDWEVEMTERGGMKKVDFWYSEEARQEAREDAEGVLQDAMERQLNEAGAEAQQEQAAAGMELAGRRMREALGPDGDQPDAEEKREAAKKLYETWAVE